MIVDDLLFMVTTGGIARCLDAKSGNEVWVRRIGGEHWASPLFADGKLFFFSKQGEITVITAARKSETIARNKLYAAFIASPAVVDNALILRSTTHLYRIEKGYQRSAAEVALERGNPLPRNPKKNTQVKSSGKRSDSNRNRFGARLKQLVASGKLTEEEAVELYQLGTGGQSEEKVAKSETVDLKALVQELTAAVDAGEMTAKEAKAKYAEIAEPQRKSQDNPKRKGSKRGKRRIRADGRVGFYSIVIGRLRSKDVELGEFSLEVDHVTSIYANRWVKDEIIGKTVKVTGVSGRFLDSLLLIKRGESLKFRAGSYSAKARSLTFGPKFHVLERTAKFDPASFGVPPDAVAVDNRRSDDCDFPTASLDSGAMMKSFTVSFTLVWLTLTAQWGAAQEVVSSAAVQFAERHTDAIPDFQKHVVPLLGRLGCNSAKCHGSFQGQAGFRLGS